MFLRRNFKGKATRMGKERCTATLKIKPTTADSFRKYARELAMPQSEALQLMLDFFEMNRLSPKEQMGPKMKTLEGEMKMRINSLIAILRDIEKTQTRPTQAMMQLLFQEKPTTSKPILVEKKTSELKEPLQKNQISSSPDLNADLLKKLSETNEELMAVLENIEVVKSSFGKSHLRLNMDRSEIEALKYKIKRTR